MWNAGSRVFAGESGTLYGVKSDGSLAWYRHDGWRDGEAAFANGGRERRFSDDPRWGTPILLDGSTDGVIYGVSQAGSLLWQRHFGAESGHNELWAPRRLKELACGSGPGDGWAGFAHVVAGSAGVLYGIKGDGTLVWYRHTGWEDGTASFANGGRERVLVEGSRPGSAWDSFRPIGTNFTFDDGYSLRERERTLERHRHGFGKVGACSSLSDDEKQRLRDKYATPVDHGTDAPDGAFASARIGGSRIDINLANLFDVDNPARERSQTLIHEMMHLIGETHPDDKGDPDYFSSPPLQAELCIAGQQSDTVCRKTAQGCVVIPDG